MTLAAFAPYEALAEKLVPHATDGSSDGSHDLSHLLRVWKNVVAIHAEEGGNMQVLAAATVLHDCVAVEKNAPLRAQASRLAAEKAAQLLAGLGWVQSQISAVSHAIEAHSFSAGIVPTTLEAKILQDADRLDAIGMVGAARCFYIAGRMGSGLYDPSDPRATARAFDDKRFAIDHFQTKLFKLAAGFNTRTGARIAQIRQERLHRFLNEFLDEI
ncbi:HD domain-containing protein [Phyllobacterium sp. 628]|uniref:HD domain-containing protein n=1 Tax=Phyllobacterium sp. 628 TaxID=2718938 RepID=UPI0016624B3B|nr:HD domain-containing protein [Phyllobacterium sp. 628]QND53156.1 HD domain-containing protein [Phyllobacterium sp. 628]